MAQHRTFSQRFWEDRRGKVIVWQAPNIWLYLWAVTLVAGWFTPYGFIQKTLGWVSLLSLVIWAVLEAVKGVNYFRRLVGVLVLLALLLPRLIALTL